MKSLDTTIYSAIQQGGEGGPQSYSQLKAPVMERRESGLICNPRGKTILPATLRKQGLHLCELLHTQRERDCIGWGVRKLADRRWESKLYTY